MIPCKHCKKLPEQHQAGKCLFEPTEYQAMDPPPPPPVVMNIEMTAPRAYDYVFNGIVCARCHCPGPSNAPGIPHTRDLCMEAMAERIRELHQRLIPLELKARSE